MSKKKLSKLLVPAIIILIPLLFFYKTVVFQNIPFPGDLLVGNYEPYRSVAGIGIVPHKGQGADVIREIYPWKYFSIEQIKQGTFPLWDPYAFAGSPHFANLQSGALYPVNVLFFIMPFVPAWSIFIFLQFIFLMTFTYLYLRSIQLNKLASIFGALSFSFSGFISVWAWYGNLGHTLAYLPLIFFSIEKIIRTQKWYWYALLIISIVLGIMAGYIQFMIYTYILAGAYVIARFFASDRKNIKTYVSLFACVLAATLIASVQTVPIFELVKLSLRSTYSYSVLLERLMPPESAITLLVPDFFGNPATLNYFLRGGSSLERASSIGVWPFIFVVFALFTKKSFYKNFFLIALITIYISILSIPPVAYFHSIGIPFLSTGIPTRALSIFCFCLAVLGAIGINAFMANKSDKKPLLTVFAIISVIFVGLWGATFVIHDPNLLISRRNLIIPTGIFILGMFFFLLRLKRKYVISLLLFLTIFELFYYFQKFNSFVPARLIYPQSEITQELRRIQGINRFWGYGSANIESNFSIMEHMYSTSGYDALFSKRYGEFTAASKTGKIPVEIERSVADIQPGYGVNDLKTNPFRRRALDLAGVRYILNKNGTHSIDSAFDSKEYSLIYDKNEWQIYENKNALPRVKLYGSYTVIPNKEKIIQTLYGPAFIPQKTLIVETKPPIIVADDPTATATVSSYSPNQITVTTNSKKGQLLFISDNYFPGWNATVDGKEVQILRADYTFRAVPVSKGHHTVKMSYSPKSFWIGLWISVVSFCVVVCVLIIVRKKQND